MTARQTIPSPGPGILILFSLVVLAVYGLTRVGLALWTGADAVPFSAWPRVLAQGLWFGAVAEATFWLEFATRFNFIAVDYLLYTHEVIGNIRESYPVAWILTGLALAAIAIAWLLRGVLRRADANPVSRRRRLAYVTAAVALPAIAMSVASMGNDYRVIDRVDFPEPTIVFENVWGVADESLFANVLRVIDDNAAQGKPSFTHVMTTSNHRPFTYPDGRIDIRSPGGRDGGVKYTDWAIGKFIDDARSKSWFEETLFVIVADHTASVAGMTKLPVSGYRIPLIFYAPKLVAPGEFTATMSQIDLPPTILDVLRADGGDDFFGRSVFELPATPPRAFISNYQELGYLKNDVLTVFSLNQKIQAFRVDPVTFESFPMPIDRTLANEAVAYYQTASRAFRKGALKEVAAAPRTP